MYKMQPRDTSVQSLRSHLTETHPSEPKIKAWCDEILGRANFVPLPLSTQPRMCPSLLAVVFVSLASSFALAPFDLLSTLLPVWF